MKKNSGTDFSLLWEICSDRKVWYLSDTPFMLEFVKMTSSENEEQAMENFRKDLRRWRDYLIGFEGGNWKKWEKERRCAYIRVATRIIDYLLS